MVNYYYRTHGSIPDVDPTVFEFPCRFPAAPSVRPENRVHDFDQKRLFGAGRAAKKFFPEFPGAAGKGRGRYPCPFSPFRHRRYRLGETLG
jgi:hypothetical protein